jgi:peptidoglycan/xylan/chitin deacetylase (PgdA/CDA1 family)
VAKPALVISLDFELYWGLIDVCSLSSYTANLRGVPKAVDGMLDLFAAFDVHATWATVGFLFLDSMDEVRAHRPSILPAYADGRLDPFAYVDGPARGADPTLHFAPHLIERVLASPGQELATHTLSHFYTLEAPTALEAFRVDLEMAVAVARRRFGAELTSIAFPRNQYSADHLGIARQAGMTAFRGSPEQWMYSTRAGSDDSRVARLARFADTYLPVVRDTTYVPAVPPLGQPVNVVGSRFLRPWSQRRRRLDRLRMRRVIGEMRTAAQRGHHYHLWWHPHNFGLAPTENLAALRQILEEFAALRETHGMRSLSMREVAASLTDG